MSGTVPSETSNAAGTGSTTNVETLPQPRKGPRGKVIIFGTWCKGCGICVEFCPTGVLALDPDGRPVVIAAQKCTACHWCDTHCPDLAIVVKKID